MKKTNLQAFAVIACFVLFLSACVRHLETTELKPGLCEMLSENYKITLVGGLTFIKATHELGAFTNDPMMDIYFTTATSGVISFAEMNGFSLLDLSRWWTRGATSDDDVLAQWTTDWWITSSVYDEKSKSTLIWRIEKTDETTFALKLTCVRSNWEDYDIF